MSHRAQSYFLGPTLFLIYINDLPATVGCKVSLYADDTLLYQTVDHAEDAATFQRNIDGIRHWSVAWQMPFNETKCHVISFGSQMYRPGYKLGGTALKWTDSTKYLGVT